MAAFATAADLQLVWRPLSSEERTRAEALLERASRMIRRRWPDVDARIANGSLDAEEVADVVLEMVQTAMMVPLPGVTQANETIGAFGAGVTFANPNSRLYFTSAMLTLFDGQPTAVRRWMA